MTLPEKYSDYSKYLWCLLPLIIFIICFYLWSKHGKDPSVDKTIIPEYEIPENLTPIETGMLMTNGVLKKEFISAGMIYLAVNGLITIEEIETPLLFIKRKDYRIKKTDIGKEKLNIIFFNKDEIDPEITLLSVLRDNSLISSLKNKFYRYISSIKKLL